MEKKYPIGGYAPGNYHCKCCICGEHFTGDKRAVQCEPCAVADKEKFDALDPNDQELLIKRNAKIANYMLSGPLSPERDLIYRIVEQWGNAIEMPNMEGWLKEYAAKQVPPGADLEEQANAIYQKYCTDKGIVYHLLDAANFCLGYMAAKGVARESTVWVKDALQWSKEAIEFASKEFQCPEHFVETWGNMYLNTLHAIDQAMGEITGQSKALIDWISVDERLPYRDGDSSVYCLVNDTYWGIVVRPFNEAHVCWDGEDGDDYYTDAKGGKITHWMPLPEPPKSK